MCKAVGSIPSVMQNNNNNNKNTESICNNQNYITSFAQCSPASVAHRIFLPLNIPANIFLVNYWMDNIGTLGNVKSYHMPPAILQ
jgi:hypothetical protein